MKKATSSLLTALLLISIFTFSVSAAEQRDILLSKTVEVLDNGDTVVTELYQNAVQPRTGTSGHRTATYYNSDGVAIWNVTVYGTFNYSYGVSATATSASATVNIYNSNAKFIDKTAYTSGNTATASALIAYNSVTSARSVSVSCDKYGNLY